MDINIDDTINSILDLDVSERTSVTRNWNNVAWLIPA